MASSKVAVVILSWNGRKFLEQFLPSVVASTYSNLEIVVADNASTDNSVEFIQSNFSSVKIISLEKNFGFAGGYNEALKKVEADYYILLNQDVEVEPNWIQPLVDLMEKNPKAAACQPKIKGFDQKTHFEYAGAAGGFLDKYGYAFCAGRIFDHVEEDKNQFNTAREIFWASGACLMIRAKLFREFGGFDSSFFAHMEEIDLCWRMKNSGWQIWYCPGSTVYHVGGGSLPQGNPRKTFLNFRNNLVMLLKNLPASEVWWKIPFRLGLDHVAAYRALFKGQGKIWLAIFKAHLHFVFRIGFWLKKRNGVKKFKTNFNRTGLYRGNITWEYFIWRRKTFKELPEKNFR